jgi:hypothetical protein
MDVMDEGAIAVSQLCKLLDRIKEKKTVSEKEIRKELNDAQFETFTSLIGILDGVIYNKEKGVFEVEKWQNIMYQQNNNYQK